MPCYAESAKQILKNEQVNSSKEGQPSLCSGGCFFPLKICKKIALTGKLIAMKEFQVMRFKNPGGKQ